MQTTTDQDTEIQSMLTEFQRDWPNIKSVPGTLKTIQDENLQLKQHMTDVRRLLAARGQGNTRPRVPGLVSDDCALHLAAQFINHCERSGKMEALASLPGQREVLSAFARDTLNLSTRTALTTTDIPLPIQYSGEIRELISAFGVVRRAMHPYPIGMWTARPARIGTRPAFDSIAISR